MDTEILQIHLNSKYANRFNNNLTSDVEFDIPIIEAPLQHTIYLSVQHAVIPYTYYNIDNYNNTLIYLLNGTTYTITIDKGNYNPYQLISFLQSNINLMTVSYNILTNKFTFLNSTYDFSFLSTSTCLILLGFPLSVTVNSVGKTLTSTNCINLQSHHCICIQSNLITGSLNSSNSYENNIICSIPVSQAPYSMITYMNHNNLKYNLFNNVISTMRLRLVDQNNNLIDLNGCNWSITVQLEIIKFVD